MMTATPPELTELASFAGSVNDPTDLQALTALRDRFEVVGHTLGPADPSAGERAGKTVKFIEKMIFGELDDLALALQQVKRTADELCGLISVDTTSALAPSVAPVEHATHDAVAHDDMTEQPIKEEDRSLIVEFIAEAIGHIEAAEVEILKLEDNPDDAEAIKGIFRAFHTVKGVAGFVNLKQVGALAHAAENLLDLARSGKMPMGAQQVNIVLESIDALKILVSDIQRAEHTNTVAPPLPLLPDLLHRLHDVASGKSAPGAAPVSKSDAAPKREADHGAAPSTSGGGSDASVKISTDRLDQLINTVGELVISQAMVSQDISLLRGVPSRATRNMSQLEKITRELQDISMSMRMVPINGIFRKMTRLVRDLASRLAKDVEFVTSGAETELDRTLVESIGDPLVHMVRNAVDHGLETPADRAKAGKSTTGRVELKAFHQGGSIVIQIVDDGKGLNKKRILQKAIDAGIVAPGAELPDEQIFQLIFHAGLSTAEKVTEVSGRGVGMDVVRKNIEALRGRVEIASVEGKGSTFTIRLPLTLAIIEGLVVRVGDEKFIVPLGNIDQSLRPTPDQLNQVVGRGETCRVRDELIPVFRLHKLFKIQNAKNDAADALLVVVRDNRDACALLVDELLGHKQVVIKSLGPTVGSVAGVSGGAILGDGNISLILDVPGLLDLAMGRGI